MDSGASLMDSHGRDVGRGVHARWDCPEEGVHQIADGDVYPRRSGADPEAPPVLADAADLGAGDAVTLGERPHRVDPIGPCPWQSESSRRRSCAECDARCRRNDDRS